MSSSKQYWLLIFSCYLLCPPHYTNSTPLQRQAQGSAHRQGRGRTAQPCAHDSIAELIRTSPVILKALGARIFTDADLSVLQLGSESNNKNSHNNFLKSATLEAPALASAAATSDAALMAATMSTMSSLSPLSASARTESVLITLTPETIYKGASLLKMTPSGESAARGRGSSLNSGGSSSNSGGTMESPYQYEGQLNATLQPLACFDENVLKMLPTELIAFGKLVTVQQQQQQQDKQQQPQQQQQQQHPTEQSDILRISINGLHRWTPQFENHIWKHLGWDDWSDFTLCSVTCGKGVQQRFRRCLLDNPMMNLNVNRHGLNAVNDVAEDGDDDEGDDDDDVSGDEVANNNNNKNNYNNDNDADVVYTINEQQQLQQLSFIKYTDSADNVAATTTTTIQSATATPYTGSAQQATNNNKLHKFNLRNPLAMQSAITAAVAVDVWQQQQQRPTPALSSLLPGAAAAEDETMRVFAAGNSLNGSSDESDKSSAMATGTTATATSSSNEQSRRKHHKRRKSTKSFSTMFCEGYNIEQRNCNTFECSDDISDLLKFYKKYPAPEEASATAAIATSFPAAAPMAAIDFNTSSTVAAAAATMTGDTASAAASATAAAAAVSAPPTSTPSNMGYIRSWRNALNFTLMITLRIKNESQTTATIFSIRNATHNLYLEPSSDGLRLYLERDNTTEMLPVKFNLFDYHWHQVAISIQNGDFISIYVDCSWTNSFVVSKRLFSLPLDADVEIGRGFNGELQQLLVLPNNQERLQCSNKRTSINEVKRYIIDTFIDDYGN